MSKYFTEAQMQCKCGCGFVVHNKDQEALMDRIADMCMEEYGVSPTITSWCRCEDHNAAVGGVPNSMHCQGIATDWHLNGEATVQEMAGIAVDCNADGIGAYFGSGFVHADSRGSEAYWEE